MVKSLEKNKSNNYLVHYLLGVIGLILWALLIKYSLVNFFLVFIITILGGLYLAIRPEKLIPVIILSLTIEDLLNITLRFSITNILIILGIVIIFTVYGRFRIVSKKSLFLIGCLFVSSILSALNSIVPVQSFRGTLPFIGVILVAILANNYLINPEQINKLFIKPYLIYALILAVYGIIQVILYSFADMYIGGYRGETFLPQLFSIRATATFLNPNKFVFFLEPAFAILFYKIIIFRKRSKKHKLKIISSFMIISLGIFVGGSKGAVLACIITMSVIILSNSKNKTLKRVFVFFVCILSSVFIIDLLQKFIYFQDSYNTTKRLSLWKEGLEIFLRSPMFGNGIDSFRTLTDGDHVQHNTYIQLLSEMGIVGIGVFSVIIINGISLLKCKVDYFYYNEIKYGLYTLLIHAVTFNALNSKIMWIFIICSFLVKKKRSISYG